MIKAYMNWSGGKDSALALHRMLQEAQYEIDCLLTSINSDRDRISMHDVRRELLEAQAASIGIPLLTIELPEMPATQLYEQAMQRKVSALKDRGCTHAIFGDIFLEDLKRYREEKLKEMVCIFPLWKIPSHLLMQEFIKKGFKAIVVCVNTRWLDKSFCGRLLDESFLQDLPAGVDPCGENGEYHSFVFDGPVFSQPVLFEKGETSYKEYKGPDGPAGFYFLDLTFPAASLRETLQGRIDSKTKPVGALGRLEELALQIGMIQGTAHPRLTGPHIVVFAGDHGIAATGLVNPYPQAVTAQMVLNFVHGGAAINALCRQHNIALKVVDAGVNFDFTTEGPLIHKKIAYGTRNYLETEAMSREQAIRAMDAGRQIVKNLHQDGCNCIGLGEMGIGNTSAAALIMSYVTGIPVEECCGRGTGVSDTQLETKIATLVKVHGKHAPAIAAAPDAVTILQHVGGFEIAMITGAYLEAAALNMVILVDGFITTAALLLAVIEDKKVKDHCVYSHTSGEKGHRRMLSYLNARPLLDLGMRLGEGTGAAMAYPVLQSALAFLREMASFESAGVSKSE